MLSELATRWHWGRPILHYKVSSRNGAWDVKVALSQPRGGFGEGGGAWGTPPPLFRQAEIFFIKKKFQLTIKPWILVPDARKMLI